ncbi:serine protease [bacterium]|nr:serine protease [bacterium]
MYLGRLRGSFLTIGIFSLLFATSYGKQKSARRPLTEIGYNKSAISTVKLVADQKVGAGVLVGVQRDGSALILTSYNMVAGQDRLAVLFRQDANPAIGTVLQRRMDLNLDVALIEVKTAPRGHRPVIFEQEKVDLVGETLTIIGHTEEQDWGPVEIQVTAENRRHLECNVGGHSGIDGAPLVNQKGHMIALVVSDAVRQTTDEHITLAVKTATIKPIVNSWLRSASLQTKWNEERVGISPWIWALGGGVLGGGVAAAITLLGGDNDSPIGLPRPPAPPDRP